MGPSDDVMNRFVSRQGSQQVSASELGVALLDETAGNGGMPKV